MILAPLANVLVLTGVAILALSLLTVRQLIAQLPQGSLRGNWWVLVALIVFFMVGYLGYVGFFFGHHQLWFHLIVPLVFFLGAWFVWLTCKLALRTARDMRRLILLEQENITDPLTGIYNRRHLERRLNEEFHKARRYGNALSIILIDIDHFKRINDGYGHQFGDLVLGCLAKLIQQSVRSADIAARYGGEEFMIVAPNTDCLEAERLAERLRSQIRAHPLAHGGVADERRVLDVTVSLGVATFAQDENGTVAKLINKADTALYLAKQAGRNRVVVNRDDADFSRMMVDDYMI